MATFKIIFSPDNIRRFRTENIPEFEKFVRLLSTQYPLYFHPEQRIQYVDTEKDKIDVTSELEWSEMFEELKNEKIFKIFILDCPKRGGGYFKDGLDPQPLYFYEKKQNPEIQIPKIFEIETPNLSDLKSRVPQCLQQLFPQKKILPYHLPTYLQNIVKVTTNDINDVDLDINITQLYDVLFKEAMSCLNRKDFSQGRDIFGSLCILEPNDVTCHYNLACAEALFGNVEGSLNQLKKAVDLGWLKLEETLKDEDLSSLRNTEGFLNICDEMAHRLQKCQNSSVPSPVVVSVPDIPEPIPNSYQPIPMDVPPILSYDESKWEAQLGVLHEFGFMNNSLLVPFLEKNDGSVERTVLDLLEF